MLAQLQFKEKTPSYRSIAYTESAYRRKFICPEETSCYSSALEQLLLKKLSHKLLHPTILEFGSGNGSPVISAILNSNFYGNVYGYEINAEAAFDAGVLISEHGLGKQYNIYNESFFDCEYIPNVDYLVGNPPYLPSYNPEALALPSLWGGVDGSEVSKKLLSYGYKNVLLEVSSFSNPVDLIAFARESGYTISDFKIAQMKLGKYSSQEIVYQRICEMRKIGKAFFSENCYLVGSALFKKDISNATDLSPEFLSCMTAL